MGACSPGEVVETIPLSSKATRARAMSDEPPDESESRELLKNQRPDDVSEAEADVLLELWDKNICPSCGKVIEEGKRVGSGRKREGGFCSLDCYAGYRKEKLIERAKRIAALAARHRNG